jgi:nicotinate-nucleotide--dimethylbenzimidazole phosphoribosyltransferase
MERRICELNPSWFRRAAEYQARLTMPTGALGRLLEIGRQLCAIQETLPPRTEPAAVVVMAADHGITEEGVSAYPSEVTGQMVLNFLRGGAAINVLAKRQGARVLVVDMGIRQPPSPQPFDSQAEWVADLAVARGTNNFAKSPAMTLEEADQALSAGRRIVVERLAPAGVRILALGDMGIGNTTSASALTAALTGQPVVAVTGRGTGIDEAGWRRKVAVIEKALELHLPQRGNRVEPMEALRTVGGFEIAGLVGAALEAARRRMLVVLDGFISSVAGLLAVRWAPAARGYLVAAHRSVEPGHGAVLEALDLNPLFDLGLRLGEGTGAALALNLIHCAGDIMRDMATFEGAGVSDRLA